jgi:hypothetical protein
MQHRSVSRWALFVCFAFSVACGARAGLGAADSGAVVGARYEYEGFGVGSGLERFGVRVIDAANNRCFVIILARFDEWQVESVVMFEGMRDCSSVSWPPPATGTVLETLRASITAWSACDIAIDMDARTPGGEVLRFAATFDEC